MRNTLLIKEPSLLFKTSVDELVELVTFYETYKQRKHPNLSNIWLSNEYILEYLVQK